MYTSHLRALLRPSLYGRIIYMNRGLQLSARKLAKGISINMPSLSPTMSEGTIVKWLKKEGDEIQPGDVLCEIQTDKAVVSLENEEEGVLAKIIKTEDSKDIKVGELIALFVESGEDWKSVELPSSSSEGETKSSSDEDSPDSSVVEKVIQGKTSSVIGPAVRTMCELYNIDISKINATGPHNNVLKGDVLDYINKNKLSPASQKQDQQPKHNEKKSKGEVKKSKIENDNTFTDIALSPEKLEYARMSLLSKQTVPHSYAYSYARVTDLLLLRESLENDGLEVSLDDLIVKCAAYSLRLNPGINSLWSDEEVFPCPIIDICYMVSSPNGIVVSLIKDVTSKSVSEICEERKKCQPVESVLHASSPGTFTVLSMSSSELKSLNCVLNVPQCAALAVGGRASSIDPTNPHPQSEVSLTLSFNACAITELEGVNFLDTLSTVISQPSLLKADVKKMAHAMI